MSGRIDSSAVLGGALASLAIAAPAVLTVQVLDHRDPEGVSSIVTLAAVLAVSASFGVGGFVAASRSGRAPLVHGAFAALAAYAVVQAIALIRLITGDGSVALAAVAFFTLIASALGVAGATVAEVRARRTPLAEEAEKR